MSQAKPMSAEWRAIGYASPRGALVLLGHRREMTPAQRRRFEKKERRRAKKGTPE